MPDDKTRDSDFSRIGHRLTDVGKRLRDSTMTSEQPPAALEEALADKVWSALGRRTDRVERFIVALRRRCDGR